MGLWIKTSIDLLRSILRRGRMPESDLLLIRTRESRPCDRLRIASYNLKGGQHSSIARLAEELVRIDPDVACLQEVGHESELFGRIDQTRVLADALEMSSVFAGVVRVGGGHVGNAILSRLPIRSAERLPLPALLESNPRAAIDATIDWNGELIRVINVHIDYLPWSGALGAMRLARILSPYRGRLIVAGDLNAPPDARGPQSLMRLGLSDLVARYDEGPTFEVEDHAFRLDYVLADRVLAERARSGARIISDASDHHAVVVEIGSLARPEETDRRVHDDGDDQPADRGQR